MRRVRTRKISDQEVPSELSGMRLVSITDELGCSGRPKWVNLDAWFASATY